MRELFQLFKAHVVVSVDRFKDFCDRFQNALLVFCIFATLFDHSARTVIHFLQKPMIAKANVHNQLVPL